MTPSLSSATWCWGWMLITLVQFHIIHVPAPLSTVLARVSGGTLWNNNKKPSNLSEKFETSLASPSYLEMTYQVQFCLTDFLVPRKSSSQPRRQMPQPTRALKCLHLQPCSEASLVPMKSSADPWSRLWCWEWGCPKRGRFRGTPLQRVYMCLLLWRFHWSDPGGGEEAEFLFWFASAVVPSSLDCGPLGQAKAPCGPLSPLILTFGCEKEFGNKGQRGREKIIDMVMQ